MDGKAVRKLVDITYSGPCGRLTFRATAFIPKSAKPSPAFVLICNRSPKTNGGVNPIDPERKQKSGFWPAEEIVRRGYAAVTFYNGDVAPDDKKGGCRKGIFPCVEPHEARTGSFFRVLRALARLSRWRISSPSGVGRR